MIYGNISVTELIDRAVNQDRLSHAYLFYGEKGLGKRAAAALFAKAILCQGENRPCGVCESCRKFDASAHPDLTVLSGTAEKNELSIREIRKLKADAVVYPNDGTKKVYLISDCQRMQLPAANALLKLLEEPPEHLVLLLTADDRTHVLPTILSRCVPVGMFPVDEAECAQALRELGGADGERARELAASCGGNIGRGLELLASSAASVSPDEFCVLLAGRREYELLVLLQKLAGEKKSYREFLEALMRRCRDAAVMKAGGRSLTAGSREAVAALTAGFTERQILERLRLLTQAERELDGNANPSLLSAWLTGELIGSAGSDDRI